MSVERIKSWCLAVLFFIALFTAPGCKRVLPNLDGSKFKEVEAVSEGIPAYPGATKLNERGRTSKPTSAQVSYHYRSDASYDNLKRFYTENLTQLGWRLTGERELYNWGEKYGGRALDFSKGEYSLVIEYAGSRAEEKGWGYTISVAWGGSGR